MHYMSLKKPNIVFITIDSLRADFVGIYNKNEKNTPFLDALARKSLVFTNAIAPANPTFFCYCSIMTGTIPFAFGNYLGIPNNEKVKTIAEVLKSSGYNTYAFLADSPALYAMYGYDRGFDVYDDGYEDTSKMYHASLEFLSKLLDKTPEWIIKIGESIHTVLKATVLSPTHAIKGDKLNQKVIQFLRTNKKEPFFLWLHYMDNHLPYFGGLNKNFFRDKNPIQRVINKFIFYKELAPSLRRMKTKNKKITEIFKEAYRSSIRNTDEYVGNIIQSLKHTYPNTIFIVTSDHGEAFMDHGVVGHGALSLYNELIRIPLIVHLPSEQSKSIAETVSLLSLAKTIAETAGTTESQFKGNNLISDQKFSSENNISCILYKCLSPNIHLGILDNETEIKGYSKLWSFTTPHEKYILEKDGVVEEYYQLSSDPLEKKNLMNDMRGKNIKIIKSLRKIINKR